MKFILTIPKISFFLAVFIIVSVVNSAPHGLPTPNSDPIPRAEIVKNTDTILTERVQKEIRNNPALKGEPISAASHEGNIILQGSVETKEQERSAIHSAQSISGIIKVESQLTIRRNK